MNARLRRGRELFRVRSEEAASSVARRVSEGGASNRLATSSSIRPVVLRVIGSILQKPHPWDGTVVPCSRSATHSSVPSLVSQERNGLFVRVRSRERRPTRGQSLPASDIPRRKHSPSHSVRHQMDATSQRSEVRAWACQVESKHAFEKHQARRNSVR